MYRGSPSRFAPIILVLIVIVIAIAALVSIGRALLGGGTTPADQTQTDTGHQALINTATDHSVRMTVRGPIVADETFHTYQVTVDPNSRNLTVFTGYLDQATDNREFGNNTKAYEEFVYALDKADLMKGTALTGDKDDTRGVCATGYVYEFEVLQARSIVKHLWTSTCKGSQGSLSASVAQVKDLFIKQIPDSNKLTAKVDL